jgi:hypothetical protein
MNVAGHTMAATATGSQDSCSLTILPPEISPPAAATKASIARRPSNRDRRQLLVQLSLARIFDTLRLFMV